MDEQVARWPEPVVPSRSKPDVSGPIKSDLKKLSDSELMDRLKAGDHDALAELFDRYHRLVLGVAMKIVRNRAEAEDLMQEVFFEVFRIVDRFDPERGTAKSWIVTFAYHKSINRRKYLALRGAFDDHQIEEVDLRETNHSPYGMGEGFPEETLETVRQGLARLTPKQRRVVELACFEGLLFTEIAEKTEESLGNVRHHYYRGIQKLREFVGQKVQKPKGKGNSLIGGAR